MPRTSSRNASEYIPSGRRASSALTISAGDPGTAKTDRYLATMIRAYKGSALSLTTIQEAHDSSSRQAAVPR